MPIPPKKVEEKPRTAKERVYSQLRQWIVDGTLKPEEKINDQELANYFSVSRTPVREAMQLLSDQKLIVISPGRESIVAPIDFTLTNEAYHIMANLYALSLEFAFSRICADDIRKLRELNKKFSEMWKRHDIQAAHRYDKEFHCYFLKIAPNEFLPSFIDILDSHITRIELLYFSQEHIEKDSFTQHENIINAIENRDLDKAIEYIKFNWLNTIDAFEQLL